MSADQWSRCPKCTKARLANFENLERQVNDSYGKVPVEEFDRARAHLEAERLKLESDKFRTWREDFDVTGAEDGTVQFDYRGSCSVCRLELKFVFEQDIPGA